MKVTIVGATGGVGRHAVQQALAAGYEVTAIVRNPQALPPGVTPVKADLAVTGPDVIAGAVAGADAVLSALGPRSKAEAGIVTKGTALLVTAMQREGARRLIVVSATPIETVASAARPDPPETAAGDGWFTARVLTPIVKAAFRDTYRDLAEMEDVVRGSGLDWTVVRPPRLRNSRLTGRYRTDPTQNLTGGRSISRADLAHFMVEAATRSESIGQVVRIAY